MVKIGILDFGSRVHHKMIIPTERLLWIIGKNKGIV